MTSKLSITVSLTIAPNTARIAVSGALTAENASAVIAVARRVSALDGGFNILIDISGLSCLEAGAVQALQSGGFPLSPGTGQGTLRPAAVPA